MIIKNMEELGRAVDVNEELQLFTSSKEWVDYDVKYVEIRNLVRLMVETRIRIKPKTVTLYEYEHCMDENRVWSETAPRHHNLTGRYIVNAVVTSHSLGGNGIRINTIVNAVVTEEGQV